MEKWAFWTIDLGQPANAFWKAWPRLFWEFWQRHQERLKLAHAPVVQMAEFMSLWFNSHLERDAQGNYANKPGLLVSEPSDFIPLFDQKPQAKELPPPVKTLSPSDVVAKLAMLERAKNANDPTETLRLMREANERFPNGQ